MSDFADMLFECDGVRIEPCRDAIVGHAGLGEPSAPIGHALALQRLHGRWII
jgi:hypothetical protein